MGKHLERDPVQKKWGAPIDHTKPSEAWERLSEPFHLGHPQTERSHIETMLDVSTQPKPSKSNEKNLEGSFAQISNPLKYRQSREGLFAIKF